MKQVIILESVSSCIDAEGYIYPLNCDGTPDLMMKVHIDDVDPKWFESLNSTDMALIKEVLDNDDN